MSASPVLIHLFLQVFKIIYMSCRRRAEPSKETAMPSESFSRRPSLASLK